MWIEPDLTFSTLACVLEPTWHYTNERDRLTVERQCLNDRVWVTAEPLLPEVVADDGHSYSASASIIRLKDAPAFCRNAEQRKEIGRNDRSIDLFRFSLPRQGEGHEPICRHLGEC